MEVNEESLLKSGFSSSDIQKIKNNIASYGGSLEEAISDLANRFKIVLWVFFGCMGVFIWVLLTKNEMYIISTGMGLLIAMLVAIFVQPPVLAYRSWRYCRLQRTNVNSDR